MNQKAIDRHRSDLQATERNIHAVILSIEYLRDHMDIHAARHAFRSALGAMAAVKNYANAETAAFNTAMINEYVKGEVINYGPDPQNPYDEQYEQCEGHYKGAPIKLPDAPTHNGRI